MNIEKFKNYNQVMLSVIVTAGVAFAVIGLISFIFFLLNEVFNVFDRGNSNSNSTYQTENYSQGKEEEISTKLYLSYGFPELIDTTNQIFLIPVGMKANDQLRQEYSKDISLSREKTYSNSGSDYYNQNYVNFIIYDAKNQKSEPLFTKKVVINQYGKGYFKDDLILLFEAADVDTDKDGKITMDDQTSIFLYSLTSKLLKQIKYADLSVLHFEYIAKTKDIIIRFGLNPSKISENPDKINSTMLCKYNYASDQLIPINNDKLQKELQEVDKKNK
jgi:hypothetical protein